MQKNALLKPNGNRLPSVFNDFFKPWNEWFDEVNFPVPSLNLPAVNITEKENEYQLSLAVPGMKKEDFQIDLDGNMLTISSEKEESSEEKEKRYTRKEYNYSSFSRTFTLPEEVNQEQIEASYEDGVLKVRLPRKEAARKAIAKKIAIH